jgi:hypothetical protein
MTRSKTFEQLLTIAASGLTSSGAIAIALGLSVTELEELATGNLNPSASLQLLADRHLSLYASSLKAANVELLRLRLYRMGMLSNGAISIVR